MTNLWGELGTASFWIDLLERTIRTACQTTSGALVTGAVLQPVLSLPWLTAVEIGASSAILCVLTGLGSIVVPSADKTTASFLPSPAAINLSVQRRHDERTLQ